MKKLLIKNYKCFGEEGAEILKFENINVIIGKNNSGKSSIIDVVKFLTNDDKSFLKNKRKGGAPELIYYYTINRELVEKTFSANRGINYAGFIESLQEIGKKFVGDIISFKIDENGKVFLDVITNNHIPRELRVNFENYVNNIDIIFDNKKFIHLTAERDIQPELDNDNMDVQPNGLGATNLIQKILNKSDLDSSLIEVKLLEELNKITKPDIWFSRILVQKNEDDKWEIYFENPLDGRVPLSKMGSGIKTILLVLIQIFVIPEFKRWSASNYVFALEELENNLHPAQQRRLYYYLYEFTQRHNCILFLTTHSNIVIDLYSKLDKTQILHVVRNNDSTEIKNINDHKGLNKILDDLDVKASDILQSNGVIWVEGPSDRVYINKWISLIDSELIEGYHYSIMFYGGKLLSNLTLDYDNLNEELIPLLKLNRNSFVVMDRDGKNISTKLNKTKRRIAKEIGKQNVWITNGREIENYISKNSIIQWLSEKHNVYTSINVDVNSKFETFFEENSKTKKIKYNLDKNKYAMEIVNFITADDLQVLDLNVKVNSLVKKIREWNRQ